MRRFASWIFFGGLVVAAFALAIFSDRTPEQSALPSIENPGPGGLKALYTVLSETHRPVAALRDTPSTLSDDAATLVIPAPVLREVTKAECEVLETRVNAGLNLVYLAPSDKRDQPALASWLGIHHVGWLDSTPQKDDPLGADATVWQAYRMFDGLHTLRVSSNQALVPPSEEWIPVAGQSERPVALFRTVGKGSILVLAGTDTAENRRIDMADNLALWARIAARGPMYFDEFHHTRPPPIGAPPVLFCVLLQMGVIGLMWLWAKRASVGPARPVPVERHRSTSEYLIAFAHLTRRSDVGDEVMESMRAHLRRVIQDRLGLSTSLPDEEIARELAERGLGGEYAAVMRGDADFVHASRRFAMIEAQLEGRAASPSFRTPS